MLIASVISCMQTRQQEDKGSSTEKEKTALENGIAIARLGRGDTKGLTSIREVFKERNPGYDLDFSAKTKSLPSAPDHRVVFIQEGGGTAVLSSGKSSKFSVGDIILLEKDESLTADSLFSSLVFTVPEAAPDNIPSFVRPDWDPNITDTPGGCATETNAYRRILLTWKDKVGPYLYHNINAHRVRIMDSFSHYHPKKGGFDEFYLVQMVQPKAQIITSDQTSLIEKPESVQKEQTGDLLQSHDLEVGDLVYLPRGVVHRGLGGVLAQVITVPGFIPGSEIGVDHHLRAINERLQLSDDQQLPYNENASKTAVVK